MNSYKSIIKADYLQRTRSYGFLITLLVSVCFAYTFIPPAGANYSTVRIGKFIGENNAAWVGHVTAIMASTFLWLFGFYLVNNGIKRDQETGVGQIIATTSISNFKYLLAKVLSNFFVLLTIAIIIMLVAVGLVIIRSNNYSFDVVQFFFPYLFATIPCIFCVSVFAVFAEVISGKYPNLQNVAFFLLFPVIIGTINAGNKPNLFWFDVLGTKYLTDGMAMVVNTNYSKTVETVSAGFIIGSQNSTTYFLFPGTDWSASFILSRLVWVSMAFILLFISSRIFKRFDVKELIAAKKKSENRSKNIADAVEMKVPLKEIHVSLLPVAAIDYGIWPFVKIEFLMLFRKGPLWFWVINIGGIIALFFIPLTPAHQIGLVVVWFLQINRWADIATKEKYNRTHYFTYAAYKPLKRLLTAQIIAGVLLATILALPVIFRYTINGDYLTAFSIMLGGVFVVALSVFSGIISGGKRFFEIVFFMLTYANVSGARGLDYFGGFHHGSPYILLMCGIIFAMLFAAFLFRKYEIANQ